MAAVLKWVTTYRERPVQFTFGTVEKGAVPIYFDATWCLILQKFLEDKKRPDLVVIDMMFLDSMWVQNN